MIFIKFHNAKKLNYIINFLLVHYYWILIFDNLLIPPYEIQLEFEYATDQLCIYIHTWNKKRLERERKLGRSWSLPLLIVHAYHSFSFYHMYIYMFIHTYIHTYLYIHISMVYSSYFLGISLTQLAWSHGVRGHGHRNGHRNPVL